MNKDHYLKIQAISIYALKTDDGYVYVGKSKSPTLASIYSRHCYGRVACTEAYFCPSGPDKPKLFLLERIQVTQAEAYKHVLAFVRMFCENGYKCINAERTIWQSQELFEETEEIYRNLCRIPLDVILERAYLAKPSTRFGDTCPAKKETASKKKDTSSERLCARLSEDEKLRFDVLADAMCLSQRDLIVYLLGKEESVRHGTKEWDVRQLIPRLIEDHNAKVGKLEKEVEKLQKKVKSLESEEGSNHVKRMKLIAAGVSRFFKCATEENDRPPLQQGKYRGFSWGVPRESRYVYPEGDGVMIFYPEMILWGNARTPVCFVLGRGEDNVRYMFRDYSKRYYVGKSLRDKRFGKDDSRWVVIYEAANDGACDIFGALPLDVLNEHSKNKRDSQKGRGLLDDLIAEAEEQKHFY